jgi:hypothetical protein
MNKPGLGNLWPSQPFYVALHMIWELANDGQNFSATEENIDINICIVSKCKGKQSQRKV